MRCPKCNKKMGETTDNSCLYYCKKCKIRLSMFAVEEEEKPTAMEFKAKNIVLRRMRGFIDALKLDMDWLDSNV